MQSRSNSTFLVLASCMPFALAQLLSETSGFALRANGSCPTSESDCGHTILSFHGCCKPSAPCQKGYNDVCCPPEAGNCTDALIAAGPRCADPEWILCNNEGYFCCPSGQTCFNDRGNDGCAYPGYEFTAGQKALPSLHQTPWSAPSSTSAAPSTSVTATASSTSSANPTKNGGLSQSDQIAVGIGVPVGVATILGTWFAWKMYKRKRVY